MTRTSPLRDQSTPEECRHAIGIEMEQRWLDAVRPSLVADHAQTTHTRQPSLFAGGRVR